MYPFKFNPILKSTIWGGEKIIPFKHLNIEQPQVGESWEISNVPGDESVVAGCVRQTRGRSSAGLR